VFLLSAYVHSARGVLTVLGPQAHILVGGNIRANTAELLKVCGDIRDSYSATIVLVFSCVWKTIATQESI
jgi:hypothetical protein